MREVFRAGRQRELEEAEKRYLPPARRCPRAVVLAASRGAALGELTAERPKCMVDVRGQPILAPSSHTLRGRGVRDITVVRGYRKEAVELAGDRVRSTTTRTPTTGELASLACARDRLGGSPAS